MQIASKFLAHAYFPRGHGIKSCNLIGTSRGPDFPISAHGHGNAWRVPAFNFHFLTPNPFKYRSFFLLDKRFGNNKNISL